MTTDVLTDPADAGSPNPTSVGHLQIDADLDERACYALSVNRRAPVRAISIRNLDGVFSGTLTVSVTSEWTAAARPPIREIVQAVDCPIVGGAVEVDFSSSRLDDVALAYLDDTTSADVIVTVRDADGHIQSQRFEILVLARNQWRADLMEITAAFVQAGHPAIPAIHAAASQILEQRTGSGSLEDYQSGPERAIEIANAIYDALSQRIPTYLTSPPTEHEFDLEGQRVRPLDMLLETGQGNCIELACAFAACTYAAGIEPVIFLLHGHAFGGFYVHPRQEGRSWNKALTTEFSSIINVIQQGSVLPLETTAIASDTSFSDAIRLVEKHFVERSVSCGWCGSLVSQGRPPHDAPHMEAVLDVARARAEGVLSLPARTVSDGQEILVIDQGFNQPPLIERRDPTTRRLLPTSVPVRVQKWKTALLDLSRRTPLISFNALDKGIELLSLPDQIGEIEDYLVDGGTIRIFGDDDINNVIQAAGVTSWVSAAEEDIRGIWRGARAVPGAIAQPRPRTQKQGLPSQNSEERPAASGDLPKEPSLPGRGPKAKDQQVAVPDRARDLLRKARTAEADTGVNTLHLALGRVTWPFNGVQAPDPVVSSPVFLVPIRMQVPRGDKPPAIAMAEDAVTTPNYSLIEALRKQFGLRLAWFDDDMADDSGLDIARGLDEIRREFMAAGLADKGLRVDNVAAVGLFPFQKVRLWKDLNDHWKGFLDNPVVKHLVEVGTGAFQDPADPDGLGIPDYDDTTLLNPQPADGAQTRAIVRALAGQSFVLEGPPGTGKSQTITNLLANALSRGMKVLFVAEKPDARSVVRERLQGVGLDPFCLDLHDQGSGPQQIKDQLRDALDFRPKDIEDKWESLNDRYQTVVEVLSGYRSRVHGSTTNGKSYFDAFESLLEIGLEPIAPIGRGLVDVPAEEVAGIKRVLRELPSFAEAAQVRQGHPWAFSDLSSIESLERDQLADAVQRVASNLAAVSEAPTPWSSAFAECQSLNDLHVVLGCARLVDQGSAPSSNLWRAISRSDWQQNVDHALNTLGVALALASELGFDATVLARDLRTQSSVVAAAANSFVMGRKGKIAAALGDLAATPAFATLAPAEVAATFDQLASASDDYRQSVDRLRSCEGMDVRTLQNPVDARVLQELRQRAWDLHAVGTTKESGSALGGRVETCLAEDRPLPRLEQVMEFAWSLGALHDMTNASPKSTTEWLAGRSVGEAAQESLATWQAGLDGRSFMALRRWADLRSHTAPLEGPVLADFRAALLDGTIPADEAMDAFDRALLSAVLTVVGEEQNFDVFDQARQDRLVQRFTQLTEERQELLRDLIPARLHASRRFDSSSNAGSVANLRTELASTRRGARSVRQLISKYPQLISELTPCFLMGPDSVAKFIPAGSITFDLIVFDEASQIRVEEAIGTMGRGQGVVVVGDSRQMPPSSAFVSRASGGEEDEFSLEDLDAPTEDAESILEETVEAGLPREMLAWHYRSRDEVLISFSNEKYYDRKLGTFPAPIVDRPGVGITYHRVNGQFLHQTKDVSGRSDAEMEARHGGKAQTNPLEADAIVSEVQRHLHDPELAGYTLGIVTLNKNQADHVEAKLRQTQDPAILSLLDHEDPTQRLLVLNLESVQGRERDIIILGTSFSNRAGTDKMPLNFGPLTNKGGERRLNVAITRARRQVIIYSSFDPEQLKDAKSLGVKHLYEYLMLAQKASQDRDALDVSQAPQPDPYIDQVAAALEDAGLTVRVGYGLSNFKVDIAVGSPTVPGAWLVGVLLDGREWAKRSLVLDRDGLPVTVLTRLMDWPAVARVWLPSWRRDPQEVVGGIVDLVNTVASGQLITTEKALEEGLDEDLDEPFLRDTTPREVPGGTDGQVSPVMDPDPIELRPSEAASPPAPTLTPAVAPAIPKRNEPRPYVPMVLDGTAGTPDDIESSGSIIRELLISLTDLYGPVSVPAALKTVARAFGLDRVRQSRLDVMVAFVPRDHLVSTPFGDYLFPRELLDASGRVSPAFDWYRASSFSERSLDQIAPQEFANAAAKCARDAFEIESDELATALLTVFGYGRKTADAVAAAAERINWAVEEGYLAREGTVIRAPLA